MIRYFEIAALGQVLLSEQSCSRSASPEFDAFSIRHSCAASLLKKHQRRSEEGYFLDTSKCQNSSDDRTQLTRRFHPQDQRHCPALWSYLVGCRAIRMDGWTVTSFVSGLTFISLPSSTKNSSMTPSIGLVTSMFALSLSISAINSSVSTASPTCIRSQNKTEKVARTRWLHRIRTSRPLSHACGFFREFPSQQNFEFMLEHLHTFLMNLMTTPSPSIGAMTTSILPCK